ncbi:tetratricopeptide repeat protein [Draconibacterium sp. IB214405]|uniref:tetratricopeptide repeat protein n=1 Tax=Draconibacterium sp. IB214405 TaxID=3097352 RepID=UPI002A11B97F|nr:tetratricopeptide repeat protein [Draconibacterium sp. IB214405]MDX8338245.1 tetratricopeptide repeat protein [Draconibacterium sp. IB214405]
MKAILRITLLMAAVVMVGITVAQAQRVIKGTVYMDGEPAAGINVEAHKGGSMMTSFDGKYEVEADAKSKYINFTFIDERKRLNIEGQSGDVFDFAFTGSIPSGDGDEVESGDVNLSSLEELMKAQNRDFLNELSLEQEFFKQNDFKSAMPHWEKLYNQYPKSTTNIYIHGGKMYENLIENAATDAERDKYIDLYMKLYDKRIKYFGERGYVLGRKGTSWLKYKLSAERDNAPEGDALKTIHKSGYEWLSESVQLQGENTEPPVLLLYMQTTVALFKLGELPKEQVVKNYEECTSIGNAIIAANEDESKVQQTQETVMPYIENIFGKSGAADCEALVNIYAPQYQENSSDAEWIKSMLRRLGRAKCTETELFGIATERLYELDPSAEAAFNMARRFLKNDETEKAREYYQMAIDQETDPKLKATYHYERGLIRFAKDGNYVGARNDARKALELDPDLCDANMLIGNIYATASSKFEGTAMEKSAVFWLACDYFAKARRGEDCSIEAAEKLRDYKKYFPNKEEAFMEGLQEGSTYHVGGWINENTKVRF